jgi:hypothetical protein
MIILVEELGNGIGSVNGRGHGSGNSCEGNEYGEGKSSGKGSGDSFYGFYTENNSKYFKLYIEGKGGAGHEHLNVSYEIIE